MKSHAGKEKPANSILPYFSLSLLQDSPQTTKFQFLQTKRFVPGYHLMISKPKGKHAYLKQKVVMYSAQCSQTWHIFLASSISDHQISAQVG